MFHLSMTLWRCKEYVLTKRPNELNTLHGTINQNITTEEAYMHNPSAMWSGVTPIFHLSMTLWRCKEYVLTKRPNELNTLHGTINQNTTTEEAYLHNPSAIWSGVNTSNLQWSQFLFIRSFFPPPTSEDVRFRGGVDVWEGHTMFEKDTQYLRRTHNVWEGHTMFEKDTQCLRRTHNIWEGHTMFEKDIQSCFIPCPNVPCCMRRNSSSYSDQDSTILSLTQVRIWPDIHNQTY